MNAQLMASAIRIKLSEELDIRSFVREYGIPQPSADDFPYTSVQYLNSNYIRGGKGKQLITERLFFTIEIASNDYFELAELAKKIQYILFYGKFKVYDTAMVEIGEFSIEDFSGAEMPLDYNDYENTSESNRMYFDVATTVMHIKQSKGGNE